MALKIVRVLAQNVLFTGLLAGALLTSAQPTAIGRGPSRIARPSRAASRVAPRLPRQLTTSNGSPVTDAPAGTVVLGPRALRPVAHAQPYAARPAWLRALRSGTSSHFAAPYVATALTNPYPSAVLGDSPSIYYRLDESTGTTASDSSGTGNDASDWRVGWGQTGALANDADTAAGIGCCGGYMSSSSAAGLPTGNAARSVEMWFATGGGTALTSWGSGTNGVFAISNTDGTTFRVDRGGESRTFTADHPVEDAQWHYLVVTYDGTTATGYVDGQSMGSVTFSAALATTATPMQVGFQGPSVDEVAVYPTALTSAQVASHFTASGDSRPSAVGTPTVTPGANKVTVSWSAATGTVPSGAAPVTRYMVTAVSISGNGPAIASTGAVTSAVFSGLPAGVSYTFRIQAFNQFGAGPVVTSGAATATGATSTYLSTVTADSPSLYYRFSDPDGSISADSSGSGNDVSGGGTRAVAGALMSEADPAISNAGVSSVFSTGVPLGNADRSVELWFRTSDGGVLTAWGPRGDGQRFGIELSNGNQIFVDGWHDGYTFTASRAWNDNNWHYLVATYDGATQTATVFLDDQLVGSHTIPSPLATSFDSGGLHIGGSVDCCGYVGSLDEVAIYPTVLSAAQVDAHYIAAGVPGAPTRVRAVARAGGAWVSWDQPASAAPVTNYTVTPSLAGVAQPAVKVDGALTSADITGLTGGSPYTFQVSAASGRLIGRAGVTPSTTTPAPAPAGTAAPRNLSVYVGYADELRGGLSFPNPWQGSPNTTFIGGGAPYDAGAVLLANTASTPLAIGSVTVDVGSAHYDLWGSNLTVPAQGVLILTQTAYDNFDTSDLNSSCTPNSVVPQVHVTIGTGTITLADTRQVLNTHGVDLAGCPAGTNEGMPWQQVGGAPGALESMGFNPSELQCSCQFADPVDEASGNLTESYPEIEIPGRGMPLTFSESYNSLLAGSDSPLGFGWTYNYMMSLSAQPGVGQSTVTVHQENGTTATFTATGDGTTYTAPTRVLATLQRDASSGVFTFTRRHTEAFLFNSRGQLTSERDLNGYATTLGYDSNGRLSTVTDTAGRALTFAYQPDGHLSQVTDPASRTVRFTYNAAGELTDVVDVNNENKHFTYDTGGVHLLTVFRDRRGNTVTNSYDAAGRVTRQSQDALARVTTFVYTQTSTTITDPRGLVTQVGFTDGLPATRTRAYGTSEAATWTYTYDPTTNGVTSITDPNTHTTNYSYDAAGNTTRVADALNHATVTTYNAFNEPLTVTDPLLVATTYSYDTSGNLLSASRPLTTGTGGIWTRTYGYTDSAYPGDVTSMADSRGKTWLYGYDTNGNRISVKDPVGNNTTTTFNVLGWKLTSVSARGNATGANSSQYTTSYSYADSYGDLGTATDPLNHATVTTYDANQNVASVTDPLSHVTRYVYDAADERTAVLRADDAVGNTACGTTGVVCTGYDPDGNITSQTDALNHATSYTYDRLNHRSTMSDPLSRVTTFTVDAAGSLKTVKEPSLRTTTFGYDLADRRTSVTYSDGTTPNVGYGYDADGQRITMTDGTGTTTSTFDSLHRVTAVIAPNGNVGYGYDLDGHKTSITYPNGQSVTRGFDNAGRMTSLTDWLGNVNTFGYDQDSDLTSQNDQNGVASSTSFDAADQLSTITHSGSGTLASFGYTRDLDGNLKTVTPTGVSQGNETYGYDPTNRLTSVNTGTYGYDPADRMTTAADGSTLGYDAADQLISSRAAITLIGTSQALDANGSGGNTLTAALPSGTQPGDQVIAAVTNDSGQKVNTPTGYAVVATNKVSGNTTQVTVLRHALAAGDTTVAVTFGGNVTKPKSLLALVYRGVDQSSPIDGTPTVAASAATGSTVTPGSITTTVVADRLVMFAASTGDPVSSHTWTPATGMSTVADTGQHALIATNAADQKLVSTGATGSRTASFPLAGNLIGGLLALRPAVTSYSYSPQGERSGTTVPGQAAIPAGYDQAGRLISYGSGASAASYRYDGDGLRQKATVAGVTRTFSWDPSGRLPMLLTDGTTNYLYGPTGLPVEHIGPAPVISLVGTSKADNSGTSSSMTLTLPAGLLANDQVVLSVLTPSGQAVGSVPSGYTKIGDYTNGTNASRITIYRHAVATGESPQVLIGLSGTNPKPKMALAAVYRGVDPDAPIDGTPAASFAPLATTITAAAITTANARDQLLVVQAASSATMAQSWTITGMTERVTDPQKLLSGAVADQALTAAGNTGTRSASFPSAADLATVTLALKAAPAPVLYYHADQLGSTRVLTDSRASVVATYAYDAYGRQTAHTGTADTPLQYAGQYRDPETGFYYLHARYYDPATSQFMTKDPIDAFTGSAYSYAEASPINNTDPTGLHWWQVAKKITDAASLAVGVVATGLDVIGLPEAGVPLGEVSAGLAVAGAGFQCFGGGFDEECVKAAAFAALAVATAGISVGLRAIDDGYEGVARVADFTGVGGGLGGILDNYDFWDRSCTKPFAPGPPSPGLGGRLLL